MDPRRVTSADSLGRHVFFLVLLTAGAQQHCLLKSTAWAHSAQGENAPKGDNTSSPAQVLHPPKSYVSRILLKSASLHGMHTSCSHSLVTSPQQTFYSRTRFSINMRTASSRHQHLLGPLSSAVLPQVALALLAQLRDRPLPREEPPSC